jgi:site-specific DNA-methyltransferase (adenine-specific)
VSLILGGNPAKLAHMGTLYYGDNLDILRRYLKDETVDLVYLDPPFNSAQNYNAFFHEKNGTEAASQIQAFEDTWHWNQESERTYQQLVTQPGKVSEVMQAFRTFLGQNDMMAYLAMMAPRLVELRRVLKPTGALYLHCDPTASHYLKLLLDAVLGTENYRNEITWKRTTAHSDSKTKFSHVTDTIFYFSRTTEHRWNPLYQPHKDSYLRSHYRHKDSEGRIYRLDNIIRSQSMGPRPNLAYEYKGFRPQYGWRMVREKVEELDRRGRLYWAKGGTPYLVRYLDEQEGEILDNLWDDIAPLNSMAVERLGYPTQKPVALLERIINASSNPGDLVLDPFCGCGTTIDAAEKHGRKWIGIDITQLATSLIKNRLRDTYGDKIEIITIGEPATPNEAYVLAQQDKYQFQWWALGLVGARPVEQKKGADHGIDGKILFRDDPRDPKPEQIIIQVKGGKTGVKDVRDLRGVLDREKAVMGVLISLQPPTRDMVAEAVSTGFYEHKTNKQQYPRLQLRTVKELMEGKPIERPSTSAALDETFKKAPKARQKGQQQHDLPM